MSKTKLTDKKCVACNAGLARLTAGEIKKLKKQLPGWELSRKQHLTKAYTFPNFAKALALINRIGKLAERIGHHPDLELGWGRVGVEIWTHKVNGLTEGDFILAAKIDKLAR